MEFELNGEPISQNELILKMVQDLAEDWPTPIPVTERLPENRQEVLAFVDDRNARAWFTAEFDGDHWTLDDGEERSSEQVTHWMPVPPAPNVAKFEQPE